MIILVEIIKDYEKYIQDYVCDNDVSKKNHFTITDFREIVVFNYRKTNVIDVLV